MGVNAAKAACPGCGEPGVNVYTCEDCDEKHYSCPRCRSDAAVCETCQSHYLWCTVCRASQHEDDGCRHVFRDDYFREAGAGGEEQEYEAEVHAFLAWLRKRPERDFWGSWRAEKGETDIVPLVRRTIAEGRFSTFRSGSAIELLSWPECVAGKPTPAIHSFPSILVHAEGESLGESGQAMDGFRWLESLYRGDAPEANMKTCEWIDEFLAERGR